MEKLIQEIENKIETKILAYPHIGNGQCNDVYKLETDIGNYCLKIEKEDRSLDELNDIIIEGSLLEYMSKKSVKHIPEFILKNNHYYIYKFMEGGLMNKSFHNLTEKEKILVCYDIAEFHFELSKITKKDALALGIKEYKPEKNKLGLEQHDFKKLTEDEINIIKQAHEIYINSLGDSLPQLLHNDAHDKNILISNQKAIFIDFGDMLWRDIHYDFYRYVFDYPKYWKIIVSRFEKISGKKLNRKRIISISLLRHLRALLGDKDKEEIVSEKMAYYSNLLKSSI